MSIKTHGPHVSIEQVHNLYTSWFLTLKSGELWSEWQMPIAILQVIVGMPSGEQQG